MQYGGEERVTTQKAFTWYRVNEDHHFLTPADLYDTVDLPFWRQFAHERSLHIHVQKVETRSTIFQFFLHDPIPFINSKDRKEITKETTSNLIYQPFEGRNLLLSEVLSVVSSPTFYDDVSGNNIQKCSLRELQLLYLKGGFTWTSAIDVEVSPLFKRNLTYCRRCGYGQSRNRTRLLQGWQELFNEERLVQVSCSICGSDTCFYCPGCINLGLSKSCEPFLEWSNGQEDKLVHVPFHWQGSLSEAQEEASNRLHDFVHQEKGDTEHTNGIDRSNRSKRENARYQSNDSPSDKLSRDEHLLWAVCGAGKTEILFRTIHRSLSKNQKVLITSPRRDVILELAPRLQDAFPATSISVLHGESKEKYKSAELFLATTHQVLRFTHYFDLIVIDEEDAFPYHHDPMLPYVVGRARKDNGTIVYLTATPKKEMIERVKRGELAYIRITERFHGQPLAIPQIQPIGDWRKHIKRKTVVTELADYCLHLLQHNRYGYLFVPHVKDIDLVKMYLVQTVLPYLEQRVEDGVEDKLLNSVGEITGDRVGNSIRDRIRDFVIESVHSQDPNRTEIAQAFRSHEIDLLITTTILERGVTISHSDVAILGCDDPIYDSASLIQIAGRVGRKLEDPLGHVWFFPQVRTNPQLEAVKMLKESNRLAKKKEVEML
jgi:competence protein ComFA